MIVRQFQPPPGNTDSPHWQRSRQQHPAQAGTSSTPRQAFPSQQFRRPLPDLAQVQPQTPQRNPRRRLPIAALAVTAVIAAACVVAAFGYGSHLVSTSRPTPQPTHSSSASQPTSASTLAPVLEATSQPTKGALAAPAVLGSEIATFVSRYGQPNDHSVPSSGYYSFRRYANSNLDVVVAQVDLGDGVSVRPACERRGGTGAGCGMEPAAGQCCVRCVPPRRCGLPAHGQTRRGIRQRLFLRLTGRAVPGISVHRSQRQPGQGRPVRGPLYPARGIDHRCVRHHAWNPANAVIGR